MEPTDRAGERAGLLPRFARLAIPLGLGLLLVVLVGVGLRLRADTDRAAETTAAGRADLADALARVEALGGEQDRLAADRADLERAIREATARLETLTADEADLADRLDERGDTRTATQERLDIVAANVDDATAQTAANVALLAALDRCLDGATEAANALSVGDVARALARSSSVQADCRTVGVAIG